MKPHKLEGSYYSKYFSTNILAPINSHPYSKNTLYFISIVFLQPMILLKQAKKYCLLHYLFMFSILGNNLEILHFSILKRAIRLESG